MIFSQNKYSILSKFFLSVLIINFLICMSPQTQGQVIDENNTKIGIGFKENKSNVIQKQSSKPSNSKIGQDNPGVVGNHASGTRGAKRYPQTGESKGDARILQIYGFGCLTLFSCLLFYLIRQEGYDE